MTGKRVLIVGGGVAGLAAATALRQSGVDVDVVEQGTSWTVDGTGIIQQAHVVRAMAALGFNDAFVAAGFAINRQRDYDHHGKLLAETVLPRLAGFNFPAMLGISRSALHRLLLAAATRAGTRIHLGVTVEELRSVIGGVHVRRSDGNAQRYDLAIGADGLRSAVRQQLFGAAHATVRANQAVWCCMLPRPPEVDGLVTFTGPGGTCGVCPLSATTMYLYLTTAEPRDSQPPRAALAGLLRERLEPYGEPVASWRAAITDATELLYRPLETLLLPDDWFRDQVLLIGDAAHTCAPHLGQGAGMAIEDAVVLAEELQREPTVPRALRRFMDRRRERVRFVCETSAELARAELAGDDGIDRMALTQRLFEVTAQPL